MYSVYVRILIDSVKFHTFYYSTVFLPLDIYKQYINREKSELSIFGETIGLSWTMNKFPTIGIPHYKFTRTVL